jgi:hypothetical protein
MHFSYYGFLQHQQKTFPSGRNSCVRVDTLRQSRQSHPAGGLLRSRRQYHASHCISPCDHHLITPHVPSTLSLRSVGTWWGDMILPGHEDPGNCVNPWNLGNSEWEQKLGLIECVFSMYDKMRWKWDAVNLPWGLPNIYSATLIPPALPLFLCTTMVAP